MTQGHNRLRSLRNKMAEQSIDLVCLAPGGHLAWLLDIYPHADERPLLFCITMDGEGLLMPSLEAESLRGKTSIGLFKWDDSDGPAAALNELLEKINAKEPKNIVIDEAMRVDHAALVQDKFSTAKRQFTPDSLGELRMRKDQSAYDALKRNAQIADKAMHAGWAAMAIGKREDEISDLIQQDFVAQGAKPLFSIVASGPNGASSHHKSGPTKLSLGDAVVMDIGASLDGYSSDITRMAIIGHAPEGYDEVHKIVDEAVEAALLAAKPGAKAKDVDRAARDVISAAGYGEYFVHRTGHGLGLEPHEPPYITATSETILDEGMVFSIEPGIYLPDRFGIRLEELVILRADGPEILSELPRTPVIIND